MQDTSDIHLTPMTVNMYTRAIEYHTAHTHSRYLSTMVRE